MAIEVAKQLVLSLDNIIIGCAQTVTFGASRERKTTVCQASEETDESRPGIKSYTMSVDALMRIATGDSIGDEKTIVDIETLFEAGTIFDFEIGPDEVGATKKTGKCWVESYEQSSSVGEDPTWSCSFAITGPVAYTANV